MVAEFGETDDGLKQLRRRWQPAEAKAAMLVVHGLGEHSGRYQHVGEFFAERGIDVLAFDNRGFGQSGGRRAHVDRFDDYLDDVEELLALRRALGLPLVLLGHSLGGLIAASYLVSDRPQPDIAVLSSPALGAEIPAWQRLVAPVAGRLAPSLFLKSPPQEGVLSRDPAVEHAFQTDPLTVFGVTAGLGREIIRAMKHTSANLDRIRVPTYVFHGEEDELVPQEVSLPLRDSPMVQYRSWPILRHECLNEPERVEVLAEIAEWVQSQLIGD